MKRRTPIRRVSVKHAAALRVYYKLRKDYLEEHPICEVNLSPSCTRYATDIHHCVGRGKYLNAVSTWKSSCRNCHEFLHQHPSLSRTKNLLA